MAEEVETVCVSESVALVNNDVVLDLHVGKALAKGFVLDMGVDK